MAQNSVRGDAHGAADRKDRPVVPKGQEKEKPTKKLGMALRKSETPVTPVSRRLP